MSARGFREKRINPQPRTEPPSGAVGLPKLPYPPAESRASSPFDSGEKNPYKRAGSAPAEDASGNWGGAVRRRISRQTPDTPDKARRHRHPCSPNRCRPGPWWCPGRPTVRRPKAGSPATSPRAPQTAPPYRTAHPGPGERCGAAPGEGSGTGIPGLPDKNDKPRRVGSR